MLKAITFPVVDGREFVLTLDGKPVFVPVEPVVVEQDASSEG